MDFFLRSEYFHYLISLHDDRDEISPENRNLLIDAPFIPCLPFVSIPFARESFHCRCIYFFLAINRFFPERFGCWDDIDVSVRFEEISLVEIFISAFAVCQEFRQFVQERSRDVIRDMQFFHHLHHAFAGHVVGIYHPLIGKCGFSMRWFVDRFQIDIFSFRLLQLFVNVFHTFNEWIRCSCLLIRKFI